MQVIRTFEGENLDVLSRGSIVTIGNFDGLHLGHRMLLDQVLERARESGLPAVVMCFEPTPQEFFAPQGPPARLMRFAEKRRALEEYGVDVFCCLDFDAELRGGSPDWFIQEILVKTLNVKHLIIGDTVSSTLIRRALSSGNLDRAAELLGKNYSMSGEVIHGNHLGRRLGFPTANIDPDRIHVALMGIFAVRVTGLGEDVLEGVASVGTRPTVGGTKMLLEVYIFDFDEDIYGRELQVEFVEKIREELNFPDIDALIENINNDVAIARTILASGMLRRISRLAQASNSGTIA